jgi:hypothetical protein
MRVTEKQVREKVKALGEIIDQYNLMRKEETKGEKRDFTSNVGRDGGSFVERYYP